MRNSPKEAISEMFQVDNLKHLRNDKIWNFPRQSNHGGLPKQTFGKSTYYPYPDFKKNDSVRPFSDQSWRSGKNCIPTSVFEDNISIWKKFWFTPPPQLCNSSCRPCILVLLYFNFSSTVVEYRPNFNFFHSFFFILVEANRTYI